VIKEVPFLAKENLFLLLEAAFLNFPMNIHILSKDLLVIALVL